MLGIGEFGVDQQRQRDHVAVEDVSGATTSTRTLRFLRHVRAMDNRC